MRLLLSATARCERGLGFTNAAEVFGGLALDGVDTRRDYCETRVITVTSAAAR